MASDWLLDDGTGRPFGLSDPEGREPNVLGDGGVFVELPGELLRWLLQLGERRRKGLPPTLCLWWQPGEDVWKGVLHDRAAKASLFRSADALGDLVIALAEGLQQEPAGWKPDRSAR